MIKKDDKAVRKPKGKRAQETQMLGGVARVRRRGDRPPSRKNRNIYSRQKRERQGILVSISENMDWESPPSILVTRNLNWSLKIRYGDWLRKGKVLAPQLRPI